MINFLYSGIPPSKYCIYLGTKVVGDVDLRIMCLHLAMSIGSQLVHLISPTPHIYPEVCKYINYLALFVLFDVGFSSQACVSHPPIFVDI